VKNRNIRGGWGLVVLELISLSHGHPIFIGEKSHSEGGLDAGCTRVSKITNW